MKRKAILASLLALKIGSASAGIFTQDVNSEPENRIGAYDFAYLLVPAAAQSRSGPVQIFDDGKETFFQFKNEEETQPVIFIEGTSGVALIASKKEGSYIRIPTVAASFLLRTGSVTSRVVYIGPPRNIAKNSAPPGATEITQAGREAAPEKAREAPVKKWQIKVTDGTLESMLRRWGVDSGWRVISEGGPEVRIQGDVEFERPDFAQAADYVITQAKQAGYLIEANVYTNRVLVIKPKN